MLIDVKQNYEYGVFQKATILITIDTEEDMRNLVLTLKELGGM